MTGACLHPLLSTIASLESRRRFVMPSGPTAKPSTRSRGNRPRPGRLDPRMHTGHGLTGPIDTNKGQQVLSRWLGPAAPPRACTPRDAEGAGRGEASLERPARRRATTLSSVLPNPYTSMHRGRVSGRAPGDFSGDSSSALVCTRHRLAFSFAHRPVTPEVAGSIPVRPARKRNEHASIGHVDRHDRAPRPLRRLVRRPAILSRNRGVERSCSGDFPETRRGVGMARAVSQTAPPGGSFFAAAPLCRRRPSQLSPYA